MKTVQSTHGPAIRVRDLVKAYAGGVRALDRLSFTVAAGTIFGLLGPNGSGKSTTVRILTTLSAADSGQATVAGYDVKRQPQQVRHAIGYVAQQSGVDINATGRENLMLQGRLYGLAGRPLTKRVNDLLERLGLVEAANRLARTYSGGMKRRLDIGLALIHRPRVLFLDEPTTGLDPEIRAVMWQEIARLTQDEGLTILLTTHYMEEADRLAARLAIVDRGQVVVEGTPAALKSQLRGDAIQVELQQVETAPQAADTLQRLGQLQEIVVDGRNLRARVDNGAQSVPLVLQALEQQAVGVAAITIAQPTLEDVYLQYSGRTFAQAEAVEVKS
jgi:ABC-2 type transport system ATP-binding protein